MSLLSKEQQDTLEFMRQHIVNRRGMVDYFDVEKALHNAVSIIDDLQSRAPKQYTEQELREAFEDGKNRDPVFDEEVERNEHGEYKDRTVEVAWYNYLRCARFLGALKAGS